MYIKHCRFQENNVTGDWLVKGCIGIEGEFSRAEWEKIKETFIAMGLMQVGHVAPSRMIPSRAMVMEAIMAHARGDNKPLEQLMIEYPNIESIGLGGQIVIKKEENK